MKLSVCIATFNRAAFIGQTLDSILPQLTAEVELVVVDGASTDATAGLMADYQRRYPGIVYRREAANGGVDRDYDRAVQQACGEYCWLMSDDDILVPDAIATVLALLADGPELVVVNAEIRTRDLGAVLKSNQLELDADREFGPHEQQALFECAAKYLSFIGAVVIRRAAWLAREREAYYDSLFIHVGVIFQAPPLARTKVVARPLVRIRYGNALWTARGFEIWTDKWPGLIWSFGHFDESARAAITPRLPATSLKALLWFRAIGAYGRAEYLTLLRDRHAPHHALARAVAALPARAANAAVAAYLLVRRHASAGVMLYDLLGARCASSFARWAAKAHSRLS
jgi:abequosyltransferase